MTMLIEAAEKLDKIQHSFRIKKKKKKRTPSKLEIERNLLYCIKIFTHTQKNHAQQWS